MIDAGELPKQEVEQPLETPDGRGVYLFRIDSFVDEVASRLKASK